MALVVFLRGVNVGGHKTFRPTELVKSLAEFDVVNIGAAGTFVVRRPVTQARLRAEVESRLPFVTAIMICQGRDILRLLSLQPFARQPEQPDLVRFVSILAKRARVVPPLPVNLPAKGKWLVRLLAHEQRFVLGLYRRQMKAVGLIGEIDRLFGMPATTRNWNTLSAIGKVLGKA